MCVLAAVMVMLIRDRSPAPRIVRSSAMLRSFKLAGGLLCCLVKLCGGAMKSIPGILQLFGGLPDLSRRRGRGRQRFKRRFDSLQLVLAEILEAKHLVPRVLVGADKFVEFELYGGRVAVLGVLEKEHHQEGDNGRAGIDDELPGVRVMKEGAGDGPCDDQHEGRHENAGASALSSRPVSGL